MTKIQTMKELPVSERPYEKFEQYGVEYLTDAELLAIILRSGTKNVSSLRLANMLISKCPSDEGIAGIYHLGMNELKKMPGIGKIKAMQIKCIGEISKRIAKKTAYRKLSADNPSAVAQYYMESLRHEEQEMVCCMMLDTKNRMMADLCITKGTVDSSLISPRELFLKALEYHAVNIILVHNHPSGDPVPSADDINITKRIIGAGELIGIHLLDHIIIGDNVFYSIMEHASDVL